MADPRALLIFVSGPQKGQRKALPGGIVRAGRSPSFGVHLTEDYVSREQMQFALTDDGWTVENLSVGNPTRINGKKYRTGRKVLLDTGDVLGAGMDTEILFVAPGDDAEEAYHAWLARADAVEAPEAPATAQVIGAVQPGDQTEKAVVVQPLAPEKPEEPAEAEEEQPPEPAGELTEEEEEARRRKAKVKKYTILFGVYFAVIIGFFVVLSKLRPAGPDTPRGRPPELTKLDIDEIIESSRFNRRANELACQKALHEAVRLYRAKRVDDGNLYRSIKQFKLATAYNPTGTLYDPEHSRMFLDAKKELLRAVWETYEEALRQSHARAWRKASVLFEDLLRMIPAKDHPAEQHNKLFDNIVDHSTYAKTQLARRRRR